MLACTLPPSLTSSSSSSSALSSTSSSTGSTHPYHHYRIPRACSQRELATHIFHPPFAIASSTSMDDQHSDQRATYHYMLNGAALSIDVEKSPHGHEQSHQVQNQARMSPPTSAIHSMSPSFMYHPYAHPHHPPYAPSLHQGSPTPQLHQAQMLTLDPAQLRASSVGPSRVLTRRQARMAQTRNYSNAAQETQQQEDHQRMNEGFGLFVASANTQRPQTPNGFQAGPQFTDSRIGLPDLDIGPISIPNSSTMSPQNPTTPASSSSNFSHYGFAQYAPCGHSRSGSSSTHPRSTSPAASIMSAATSLSSGSNPKPKRSRPPISTASASCISVASFTSTPTEIVSSKPKRRLQNRQRKEICQFYLEHPNSRQEDIAQRWGVERSTVSKILKHKNRWMAVTDGDDQVIAKHRPPKFGEIERRMEAWLAECRDSQTPISDAMIRSKALEYAQLVNVPEDKFKASAGWVENYKHRANIKKGVWIGRPLPGVYSDDESDDDAPLISDLVDEYRRAEALKAADERAQRIAEGLEADVGIDLNTSPASLGVSGDWVPSLGITFGDAGSTNHIGLEGGINRSSNDTKQQTALKCQPPASFSADDNILQQHFNVARASWAANAGMSTANMAGGPPPVSPKEASAAMNTVLRFLETQRPDFLNEQERNLVTDIKHLIWVTAAQAASASAVPNAPTTSITAGTADGTNTSEGLASSSGNVFPGGEQVAVHAT